MFRANQLGRSRRGIFCAAVFSLLLFVASEACPHASLPERTLAEDLDGKPVDAFALSHSRVVVLLFVRTDCPISNRYAPRLQKLSEKFDRHLRKQEELIAQGKLTEAERKRVEFERNMTKYVGAPLLGAFSCAAGAAMFAQIVQPGRITGAPISWLLGGNPFLDGVWLFGNGVICFHQGYKFFMIALADQEEVARVVREIKGLLPAVATS